MKVIGIDLSGPANHKDTAMVIFQLKDRELVFEKLIVNASDQMLLTNIKDAASKDKIVIGMDAPLSYQDGGGDRPQDKGMRNFMKEHGLSGSSIMAPTMTKMVYLTLRGISLSHRIMAIEQKKNISLVEVHPGGAIGTRLEEEMLHHARTYKKDNDSGKAIYDWFPSVGLLKLPEEVCQTSHTIDACGAALAAWHWGDPNKKPMWLWDQITPEHPYPCCC